MTSQASPYAEMKKKRHEKERQRDRERKEDDLVLTYRVLTLIDHVENGAKSNAHDDEKTGLWHPAQIYTVIEEGFAPGRLKE